MLVAPIQSAFMTDWLSPERQAARPALATPDSGSGTVIPTKTLTFAPLSGGSQPVDVAAPSVTPSAVLPPMATPSRDASAALANVTPPRLTVPALNIDRAPVDTPQITPTPAPVTSLAMPSKLTDVSTASASAAAFDWKKYLPLGLVLLVLFVLLASRR